MKKSIWLARRAAMLSMTSLVCIIWSVVVPRPLPVVVAMTIGQTVGTISLAIYLFAVLIHED